MAIIGALPLAGMDVITQDGKQPQPAGVHGVETPSIGEVEEKSEQKCRFGVTDFKGSQQVKYKDGGRVKGVPQFKTKPPFAR